MKGIIIYEDYRGKEVVEAIKLGEVDYTCKSASSDDGWINELSGIRMTSTQAYCNKDDEYDFETGALISLMKMCGSDKVVRACNEAFSYETDNKLLRKDNNNLREANKGLQEEVKRLKGEGENRWKKYQRNIQKKQDRINELNNIEEEYIKLREEYDNLFEEKEKLQHEYNLCLNSENALKCTVDLFKKLDQKKVDAAYKEAYDKWIAQPIWQKEVFKQIHKDQLASLLEAGKWLYRIPTKRDEMWNDIRNSEDGSCVEVNRGDVIDFLKDLEKEMPNVRWATGDKLFSIKPMFNPRYNPDYDKIYFFIDGNYVTYGLSKDTSRGLFQHVIYLSPMRWDLFKKGRLAVKVNYDNYKEFYEACEKELGKKPSTIYTGEYTVSICKKDGLFQVYTVEHQKSTGRKIVNWEDVR